MASELSRNAEERIVDAAQACFERFGIAKTTMEDIASQADLSRRTVYRYFAGKDDVLDAVCCREAVKINAEVRRRLPRGADFATTLSEALTVIIEVGRGNPYLASFTEAPSFQAFAARGDSRVFKLNRDWWHAFMQRAADKGELADDLSLDEILAWLTTQQGVLQHQYSTGTLDDAALRRVIRRLVVAPLVARVL